VERRSVTRQRGVCSTRNSTDAGASAVICAPTQVFEYFASVSKKDGSKYMLPADMMRACVPVFAPEGSDAVKSGGLGVDNKKGTQKAAKASKFFQLFDTDGDGLIDFPEYIFFVRAFPPPS
jgi:hypothetical protein